MVDADFGELLTRWSVRFALGLYVLALSLRVNARLARARLAWSGGYGALLLHLACAFHFYHHWSHDDAWDVTARRTEAVVGIAWGGGVYANYAFALVWGADVAWWWLRPRSYATRSWLIEGLVQGFLAFLAFNATVVFGTGAIRWLGLAGCLVLAVVLYQAARSKAEGGQDHPPKPTPEAGPRSGFADRLAQGDQEDD